MAVSVVDHDFGSGDASSTTIATGAGLDVQVGDVLVACAQHETGADSAITFSGGNATWTAVGNLAHSGVPHFVYFARGEVTSAGSGLAVTGTIAASRPFRSIVVVQLRGASAMVADWESVERNSGLGVTFATPALTFTRAGIIVGITAPYEGRSFVPTSPAVEVYDPASYYVGAMTRDISAAGSFDIGTTVSGTFNGFVIGLGFEILQTGYVHTRPAKPSREGVQRIARGIY